MTVNRHCSDIHYHFKQEHWLQCLLEEDIETGLFVCKDVEP